VSSKAQSLKLVSVSVLNAERATVTTFDQEVSYLTFSGTMSLTFMLQIEFIWVGTVTPLIYISLI
jgi:hypothetical protein